MFNLDKVLDEMVFKFSLWLSVFSCCGKSALILCVETEQLCFVGLLFRCLHHCNPDISSQQRTHLQGYIKMFSILHRSFTSATNFCLFEISNCQGFEILHSKICIAKTLKYPASFTKFTTIQT